MAKPELTKADFKVGCRVLIARNSKMRGIFGMVVDDSAKFPNISRRPDFVRVKMEYGHGCTVGFHFSCLDLVE